MLHHLDAVELPEAILTIVFVTLCVFIEHQVSKFLTYELRHTTLVYTVQPKIFEVEKFVVFTGCTLTTKILSCEKFSTCIRMHAL